MSIRMLVAAAGLGLLAACGGGGGGSIPEVPFVSFAAAQPNETLVMSGISQTGNGTDTVGPGGLTVTSAALDAAVDASGSTARLTYGVARTLTGIGASTPTQGVSFSRSSGDAVSCSSGVCTGEDTLGFALVTDPYFVGWNYQTFGAWLTQTSASTFQFGSISAGSVTPAAAVPPTGSAVFTGFAHGFLIDSAGTPFFTAADMSAAVNFTSRSIGFSTSGTLVGNLNNNDPPTAGSGYDLSGNLTYDPAVNRFTGSVVTQNTGTTGLSGSATGRFYGPAAQEIGGVYSLSGNGLFRMLGGFGGKR